MGLKSSPYHLKMFMNIVFSQEQFDKLKEQLSQAERDMLPSGFTEIVISYFDDCFVFADTYEQLLVCFKLCLMAARQAKIKFSIEKTTFFTTKIKVLGYSFDTKDALLTMDRLKSSAISNMKKPSSLFELHSRLCAFQYQSMFLPYLKHILYPLHYMLRKREWHWGQVEEEAWTIAKQLSALGLKLTIPDAADDLVLTTDASKVAASACLFRVKDNKLDLVAVNSKYFNVTDLNKCSYVLESIALAYGLKVFASYILNCEGKIRVFTDARSLIYCKRNSTHSILLNSTLNYLTNFVTLTNMEIYHLPGDVNILADVMSRAIADNLNCALNREHPISKQWAKEIPPIPDNFSVDRDTLFKFLTNPLKPEIQDTHDRRMRKLMEPKSVQQWFDISKGATSEERFYNSIRLLEQWNYTYNKHEKRGNVSINVLTPKEKRVKEALSRLLVEKNKECTKKIEEIMEKMYADIKDTPLFRKVRNSLVEASKQLIKINNNGMTEENVKSYTSYVNQIMRDIESLVPAEKLPKEADLRIATLRNLANTRPEKTAEKRGSKIFTWELKGTSKFKPSPENGALTLKCQEDISLRPNEVKIIELGVRVHDKKGHKREIVPDSYIENSKITMNADILCSDSNEYCKVSLQNRQNMAVKIPEGSPIARIYIYRAEGERTIEQEGQMCDPTWEEIHKNKNLTEVRDALSTLNPERVRLGNITINLHGDSDKRLKMVDDLRGFDNENLSKISPKIESMLQTTSIYNTKGEKPDYGNDSQAMLAADLIQNNRLSVETLIKLQNEDEGIKTIKENLVGNPDAYNTYILKSGLVCKTYTVQHAGVTHLGIYIPTSILRAIVQYVHRRSLHTSITQTHKEFMANYYHPRAMREVKNICRECVICSQSRNTEKRDIHIGRERTVKPERPREGISADILYFPKSTSNFTHGLLIGDLFSLYVSFYPMKNKGSAEVAKCFRAYFAAQGVPKSVYTDSDPSFRGNTETLFRTYNVTHVTSYPYTQKENAVESQVRIFKNAYRAAILENNIFKIPEWDVLYPLVICRINALISKYGMSRESVHFGTIVESSLPLITDCELFNPLEDDLKQLSDRFRDKIGKFLMRKKRKKELYNIGKKTKFFMYELVMKVDYTADSLLAPVYRGPFRIVNLDQGGARLKDVKTGEEQSVSFEHMRKLKLDELLTLLPQNFDAEISSVLDKYRYKKGTGTGEEEQTTGESNNRENNRKLRSGRLYNVNVEILSENTAKEAEVAYWREERVYKREQGITLRSILIAHSAAEREIKWERDLEEKHEIVGTKNAQEFTEHSDEVEKRKYKRNNTSRFSSEKEGTMIVRMKRTGNERPGARVKFKEIIIHFY
jgi:dUTPase